MKNFWKFLLYIVQFAVGLFVLNLVIKKLIGWYYESVKTFVFYYYIWVIKH